MAAHRPIISDATSIRLPQSTITRPEVIETTVAGACFLAGLGEGVWASADEIARVWRSDRAFEVKLNDAERAERMTSWQLAVDRTLYTPS